MPKSFDPLLLSPDVLIARAPYPLTIDVLSVLRETMPGSSSILVLDIFSYDIDFTLFGESDSICFEVVCDIVSGSCSIVEESGVLPCLI